MKLKDKLPLHRLLSYFDSGMPQDHQYVALYYEYTNKSLCWQKCKEIARLNLRIHNI